MTTPHWKKASALLPLAVLSGGWTVMLTVASAGASPEAKVLPPLEALDVPASVSPGGEISGAVTTKREFRQVSAGSANGIPAAALSAYQRAAQVIGSADPGCHITWPLIAAIGRVESDHGRFGGSVLSEDGVATPPILGTRLDGSHGTARITDTDAGLVDHDTRFDRAVGPMQFIPSTWSLVGVDGDGDSRRNPQDIDDAALAAAVYLCSGKGDLSTESGVEEAVFRYNHSDAYVALVRSIAASYADGDYVSAPTGGFTSVSFTKSYDDSVFDLGTTGHHHTGTLAGKPVKQTQQTNQQTTQQTNQPSAPTTKPSAPAKDEPNASPVEPVVTQAAEVVSELRQATEYCVANLTQTQLDLLGGIQACAEAYLDGGSGAISGLLGSLGLGNLVGGVLPKNP